MQTVQTRRNVIAPQEGPQTSFLSCDSDIVIYGGAAGGGKTWGLLLDALRFAALEPVYGFSAVIFRRTVPQILAPGGLWDGSFDLYSLAGGKPNNNYLEWRFARHGTKIKFSHMQHDKDKLDWQGAQIAYIAFDELTHFTESQFFYMLSRNRTMCGVKPRMRATCNPDADSWVKTFIAAWVDDKHPDPAESGEIRYFIRDGDQILWYKRRRDVPLAKRDKAKSVTFIAASIWDNPKLLETNPEYLASLEALPLVDRERLLKGNWNIRPSGNKFRREWWRYVDEAPADLDEVIRYWDLAASEESADYPDPDWTVGVKLGRKGSNYYVLDVVRVRATPKRVNDIVLSTAQLDGYDCPIMFEQEPGSAGKRAISDMVTLLDGFDVSGKPSTGSKETRANGYSSQVEHGNVYLVRAPWNDAYINELSAFPNPKIHDDQVDGSSGAYNQISRSGHSSIPAAASGQVERDPSEDDLTPESRFDTDVPEDEIDRVAVHSRTINTFLHNYLGR